jgi:hypothetical protein
MATINHKTYNEATETFKDFNVYDGKETLIFKVDGSEGNVGIGTSSPTDTIGYGRALDIQSSTGAVVYLRDSNAPTTQYGFLAFDGSDNGLKLHNANSSGFLRFDTNATEKMRITSTGNVGIGTSTPSVLLDVQGNSAAVRVAEVGGAEARLVSGGSSSFVGTYSNHPLLILTNSGEKMRIEAGGNVGIGTSSPTSKLHVQGTSYFFDQSIFSDKVGIGTSSPATKLDVAFPSDGTAGAVFGYTGGTNNPRIFFNVNESTSKGQIIMSGSSGALDLGIGAGGTEIITLKGTGNVGIGTTSPADKLHIEADNGGAIRLERNDPTINNGNRIGGINFAGNESGTSLIGASIEAVAAENWVSPTSYGSDIVFYQASTGTSSYAERFRFRGSGGLTFNGDTAAANALDDYEEGTWTPQISNGTTNVAISNSYSTYTKIGRQVTVNTRMVNGDLSSFSSGDNISFIGLPFTSGGDYYSTIYVRGAVSGNLVRLLAIGNGTTTAATDLFVSELVDGASDYWFTATYFV